MRRRKLQTPSKWGTANDVVEEDEKIFSCCWNLRILLPFRAVMYAPSPRLTVVLLLLYRAVEQIFDEFAMEVEMDVGVMMATRSMLCQAETWSPWSWRFNILRAEKIFF
nr:hypothetical protein Iba_chr11aCG12140 [Ipomoea batatas]